MLWDKNKDDILDEPRSLSRRGEVAYYIGALFFISGIGLLIFGTISTLFFQVHYGSEDQVILTIVSFIGSGLILIALGLNFMIRQGKKGYAVTTMGIILSLISIILFLLNFQDNWYYPMISYILIFYIIGLMLLMGNAFGNVTVWLIHASSPSDQPIKTKKQQYEYTDEEIERDIENAVQKSLAKAADELQFDLIDTKPLKVGNASFGSETVVKMKDDIKESYTLEQTQNPGEREEWGATGIDKISNQLANALIEKPKIKKSRFKHFFNHNK